MRYDINVHSRTLYDIHIHDRAKRFGTQKDPSDEDPGDKNPGGKEERGKETRHRRAWAAHRAAPPQRQGERDEFPTGAEADADSGKVAEESRTPIDISRQRRNVRGFGDPPHP